MSVMSDSGSSDEPISQALVLSERTEHDGHGVVTLTLNRPREMNPLDRATLEMLRDLLVELSVDQTTRAIVITGAGAAFSAGGDLKAYQTLYRAPEDFARFLETFRHVCELLERSSAVTVAMVNGSCVAGGLELALACDLVTMAEGAVIGDGHLRFGQLPGAGGSQRLVRAIGRQRARHWLLTARLFDAPTALVAGLVVGAFPAEQLRAETLALLTPVLSQSPLAVSKMKELIRLADEAPLSEGLLEEVRIVSDYAVTSHDATEGLMAFAERRPPVYRGS
jgi:enoyl-CoA hydratase/carnithine racemase